MQARTLLTNLLVATVVAGGTMAATPASPANAADLCLKTSQGWDQGYTYGQECLKTAGTVTPPKSGGTVMPKYGSQGGQPKVVHPELRWSYSWTPTDGCDIFTGAPVSDEPAPPVGNMTHTPYWSPASSQPLPEYAITYTVPCIPEPETPPATPPGAPADPPLPDDWWANGQAQLGLAPGDIWTDYQHAFLTGTTATFVYTVEASAITSQMSGSGFNGAVNAALIGVHWDIDGTASSGVSTSHQFRLIGDGVAPITAVATWEVWGYAVSPLGTVYEWRITVDIPSSMSRPVNQIISARTEPTS